MDHKDYIEALNKQMDSIGVNDVSLIIDNEKDAKSLKYRKSVNNSKNGSKNEESRISDNKSRKACNKS